ncbi:SH3 domain-containing protein [Reichenbachiella carrageenanivorans]|uniref:SH3 domain-containing protein n=1 Tax=Reichenbachiella carrageenanivorans TaxID=2979869 RepID=A0ABY6D3X0_9BACT|nr:SH3 domain-containing protein [Reichenbachiella carrageenanivorans]UXX80325.1 SH3 domain-containing protein [Reichenbachiella carrageenanivorans]
MIKLFTTLFLLTALAAQAQDSTQNSHRVPLEFKADDAETTLELQFTPFGNTPVSINGIRARWFTSGRNAFRLNIFAAVDSDTEIIQQELSSAQLKELKYNTTTIGVNVRPGFERHLEGTKRLSPYFGLEFDLAYQYSSEKEEYQNGSKVNYNKVVNEDGFVRLGANWVAGFDFYIAKKLYLGTEFGYGFSYTKLLAVKVKSNQTTFTEPEPDKRGGSFDMGPNVNAQIRLGYAF